MTAKRRFCCQCVQRLRAQHPGLCLVLAPRHLERVETVARHVQACQLSAIRRSRYSDESASGSRPDVIILDTLGELVAFYRLCTVAFVGGSLAPIGGHNILEPVMFAKPLLFGPHLHHFPELANLLRNAAGAMQVRRRDGPVHAGGASAGESRRSRRHGPACPESARFQPWRAAAHLRGAYRIDRKYVGPEQRVRRVLRSAGASA